MKALARMFGGKGKKRTKEFPYAVPGTLRLTDENWWEATVAIDGRTLGFKIGGDVEPDAALVEHAHDIVRSVEM